MAVDGLHQQLVPGHRVLFPREGVVHQRLADAVTRLVGGQVVGAEKRARRSGPGNHAQRAVGVKEFDHDHDGTEPNRRGQMRSTGLNGKRTRIGRAAYFAAAVSAVRPRRLSIT